MNIKAISISDKKGMRKKNVASALLLKDFGIKGDAHADSWHRQISFLAQESIKSMQDKGLQVVAGNFAENLTTEGIDLTALKVGANLKVGDTELVISQLGKICHNRCAIYYQAGDCVMPREGIFAVVTKGGAIRVGDSINIVDKISTSAAIISSKKTRELYETNISDLILTNFHPAFIRYEVLSDKEGGGIKEILADLCDTQGINTIIVLDPDGSIGLGMYQTGRFMDGEKVSVQNQSTLYYCREPEEFHALLKSKH